MDDNEIEGDFDEVLERLGWQYSPPPPDPTLITDECLSAAEESAGKVVNCIRPTPESEDKRREIIDHMQRLIKSQVDCEVFPYGSVPLKTYLPDGDIDLTAFQSSNADDSFANNVFAVIRAEEQNQNAEYRVKDTQFIDAEVKIVKCVVRSFVVDISFNQLGGLSTLCFLEQIDRIVGKNHLFKRSIMLVKTWCYHESRILGAHYGLLSTYALETLILYIFHMFHSSLSGPLAVLYRFLEYYSKFDWENYCFSLKGPVCKASLPNLVVKKTESDWNDWMLSEEFLDKCMGLYSVPLTASEEKPKGFQFKCLNIIDPLKENNNLGRSVHRGNYYRIRSALKYGARKLGQVLVQPREKIASEISDYFSCTLSRHGYQPKSTLQYLSLESSDGDSAASFPDESHSDIDMLLESSTDYESVGPDEESVDRFPEMASESCDYADGVASSRNSEPYNPARSSSSLTNGISIYTSSSNYTLPIDGKKSFTEDASTKTGNSNQNGVADSTSFNSWLHEGKSVELKNTYRWCMDSSQTTTGSFSTPKTANILETLTVDTTEMDISSTGELESLNHLAELTGDYDSHVRCLLHCQFSRKLTIPPISPPVLPPVPPPFSPPVSPPVPPPVSPPVPPPVSLPVPPPAPAAQLSTYVPPGVQPSKNPWDVVRQSIPFVQNHFSQTTTHMVSMEQYNMYPDADPAYFLDWKQRGTGTYFPNAPCVQNGYWQNDYMPNGFYMERPPPIWNRHTLPNNHYHNRNRNRNRTHFRRHDRRNLYHHQPEAINHIEPAPPAQNRGRLVAPPQSQPPKPVKVKNPINDEPLTIEFGSIGNLAKEVIAGTLNLKGSSQSNSIKTQDTTTVIKQEKVAGVLPIRLKSDDEFPTLCQSYA